MKCAKRGIFACQLLCNECSEAIKYFCHYAPDGTVDACIARGKRYCLKNKEKRSCSQCRDIKGLCRFALPKYLEKCADQADRICYLSCNKCQEFTAELCALAPAPSVDACIAKGRKICPLW